MAITKNKKTSKSFDNIIKPRIKKDEIITLSNQDENLILKERGLYIAIYELMQMQGITLSYIQQKHEPYYHKYRRFITFKNGSDSTNGVDDETLAFFAGLTGVEFQRAAILTKK